MNLKLKSVNSFFYGAVFFLFLSLAVYADENSSDAKIQKKSELAGTASTGTADNVIKKLPGRSESKSAGRKKTNIQYGIPSVVSASSYMLYPQYWDDFVSTGTPFGTASFDEFALKGNLYFLKPNTSRLPQFATMTPDGTVYIKKLDIPNQSFTKGFPGVGKRFEWFGIRYIGGFSLSLSGQYKFRLVSDDGAKLWIDNQLVVDNDGIHPLISKSGTAELGAGKHLIQVDYFQGPRRYIGLQLYITEPDRTEKIFTPDFVSNKTIFGETAVDKNKKSAVKFTLKFIRSEAMKLDP